MSVSLAAYDLHISLYIHLHAETYEKTVLGTHNIIILTLRVHEHDLESIHDT